MPRLTGSRVVPLVRLAVAAVLLSAPRLAAAQDGTGERPFEYSNRLSLVGGLSQVALGGGNIEGTWYTERFSFEYSHGFNLKLTGSLLSSADQNQKLALREPWTTGFGIGYRLTETFDLRVEGKAHRFEVFYDGQGYSGTPIASYTTATVGVGAYYRYYPFKASSGWARGLVLNPSVRYWPNVYSSLDKDRVTYANARTGKQETHEAETQGIPGTKGLFVNVSVGYTF